MVTIRKDGSTTRMPGDKGPMGGETDHTPEPWQANKHGEGERETYTIDGTSACGDAVRIAVIRHNWMDWEEFEANACLIAQSPALYAFAALIAGMKTEEEFGDDAPPSEDWISTLNDLIAQARELEKKVTE